MYELDNLETLCIQCHDSENGKEKNIIKRACKFEVV
ncbi:hypothetical protein U0X36_05315 [Bacillus thuringiensis]|nr:hypothetical protein [Bacillus thuringiensis]MDZ3952366.1 hypothetical protein [Bacillus thuringiensis]